MHYFLITVLIYILNLPDLMAGESPEKLCKAPELVVAQKQYNKEVCAGISMAKVGNHKAAILYFEKALQMNLLEVPNFQLIPRLALMYSYVGLKDKSMQLLGEAELALKVYTRIYRCSEQDGNFTITRNSWGKSYRIDSPHHDRVAGMMCGDAYDYIYHPESLMVNIREATLVQNYLSIKKEIDSK